MSVPLILLCRACHRPRPQANGSSLRWLPLGGLGLAVLVLGCVDDGQTPTELTPPQMSQVVVEDPEVQQLFPAEADFLDIASREPTFAGYFLDGDVFVGNTTETSRDAAIVGELERYLPALTERGRSIARIETRTVDFSFLELANWRNLAYRHVMQLQDVNTLGVNERSNRLRIGLKDGPGQAEAERMVDSLGIPAEAVEYAIRGALTPGVLVEEVDATDGVLEPPTATYLTDRIRPIPGGVRLRIGNSGVSQVYTCTMGFSARRWPDGAVHLLTNSHCTRNLFDLDAGTTSALQFSTADTVATETVDPDGWDCGFWSWEPDWCRYSDAAAFQYDVSVLDSIDFGAIARPEGPPGTGGNQGDTLIDLNNPRFYIDDWIYWPMQGDSVDKVGIIGGWTTGQVTDTCDAQDYEEGGVLYRVLCGYTKLSQP